MEPGQSKFPGLLSILLASGPQLQGAEQGSEVAGETGDQRAGLSFPLQSELPALFPAFFPTQFRFGAFILLSKLRASLHPLWRRGAGTDCSLRRLGEGMGRMSPRGRPGCAAEGEQLGAS